MSRVIVVSGGGLPTVIHIWVALLSREDSLDARLGPDTLQPVGIGVEYRILQRIILGVVMWQTGL